MQVQDPDFSEQIVVLLSDFNCVLQEEDNFGLNDSDWDVYKQISRDAEDSDSEEENLKAQVKQLGLT